MTGEEEVARALTRGDMPSTFERWRVELAPGTARPTSAGEWAGSLVLVRGGRLDVEIDCAGDRMRSFAAGSLLALGWLPLCALHNRGSDAIELVAVRRRGAQPTDPFIHVLEPSTWDRLASGDERLHVASIGGAKADETWQRRIATAIAALHEGRSR